MGTVLIATSVIIGVLRQHANAMALAGQVKGAPKAVTDAVIGEVLAHATSRSSSSCSRTCATISNGSLQPKRFPLLSGRSSCGMARTTVYTLWTTR